MLDFFGAELQVVPILEESVPLVVEDKDYKRDTNNAQGKEADWQFLESALHSREAPLFTSLEKKEKVPYSPPFIYAGIGFAVLAAILCIVPLL